MSTTQELFEFIKSSPTAFHAADTVRRALEAHGFVRLYEEDEWQILPGKYYVMRGMSSVIAFKIPHSAKAHTPFSIISRQFSIKYLSAMLMAAHSLKNECPKEIKDPFRTQSLYLLFG